MKTFFRVNIYISVLSFSFGTHQMATGGSEIVVMQDSPQALFTFSDSTGKLLITLGSEPIGHTPEFKAIESNGKTYRLEYVERRESKPKNTGRLTASNFGNLGGHLFRLLENKLEPDRTVLLCAKRFLSKRQPLKVVPSNFEPLDSSISSEIAKIRNIEIERTWKLATISEDKKVALIKFKPKPKLLIASLVLILDDRFVFEDFIGNSKDETSVWRVDDQGEISPDGFKILCAFQCGETIEIVRSWAAFEGENIVFLKTVDSTFQTILEAHRYWAPL